jgi:hypothetical protein
LDRTLINDEDLILLCKANKKIEALGLGHTAITNRGVGILPVLVNLQNLILDNTKIDDNAIHHLKKMENLRTVFLFQTGITDKGFNILEESLPKTHFLGKGN